MLTVKGAVYGSSKELGFTSVGISFFIFKSFCFFVSLETFRFHVFQAWLVFPFVFCILLKQRVRVWVGGLCGSGGAVVIGQGVLQLVFLGLSPSLLVLLLLLLRWLHLTLKRLSLPFAFGQWRRRLLCKHF